MSLPDEAVVRRTLSVDDRDARIRLCIEKSWSDLKDKYTERSWWRRKSTTRGIMWENCVEAVAAEFESDSGIKPVPHYDTVSFVADDLVLFRLKKATSGLFTANYPTTLAELFHVHKRDLFGHEGHHRVEIVHTFNRFQSALEWIGVVAREENRIIWQFELPNKGASITELPKPMPDSGGTAAEKVLRPAKTPNKKKNDEEKE